MGERFGGVIGHVTEIYCNVKKGNCLSQYLSVLSERVNYIICNAAAKRRISNQQLAKDWLNEIKSDANAWRSLREAGL